MPIPLTENRFHKICHIWHDFLRKTARMPEGLTVRRVAGAITEVLPAITQLEGAIGWG
jgi:hypothetical protein